MTLKSVDPIAHRRDPTQRRARELITAIRGAALEIIEKDGPAALTTNRVAERAGVSIGSLYHYYPNKESIVADLFEARVQALVEEIDSMRGTVQLHELPLDRALASYMAMALRHRSRLAHIHSEFLRDFGARFEPPTRLSSDGRTLHELTLEWLHELLARNRSAIEVPDLDVAARMIVILSEGFARAAGEERLPDCAPEVLVAVVTRAMLAYLRYREPA